MIDLPAIVSVTLFLDEAREYPALIVTGTHASLSKTVVAQCHQIAGDNGATVEFRWC